MVGAALKVLQQGHPAAHHVGRRQGHAPAGLRRQPPHATGILATTDGRGHAFLIHLGDARVDVDDDAGIDDVVGDGFFGFDLGVGVFVVFF